MRRLLALTVAGMLVLAACGGDDDSADGDAAPVELPGTVNDEGTETVSGDQVDLEADDFSFGPTFLEADGGTTLTVTVENVGDAPHTFTIDDADIDEELDPGASAEVEVTVPDSGSLAFYCRLHRGQGMQGAFVVAE
jgi:plastocyanin